METQSVITGPGGTPESYKPPNAMAVEKEGFLKLLVAQVGNQDPLAPKDSEQFVQQLTQFSQLEQMMNVNEGVTTLNLGQLSNNSQQAVGFVGQRVVASGDSAVLEAEGNAGVNYTVHGEAATVSVKVKNEQGYTVHEAEIQAPEDGDERTYTWDGLLDGDARAPEGRYTFEITAKDADDGVIPVETMVDGVVESVRFDNGYPELMIGGRRVMMSAVREVRRPR